MALPRKVVADDRRLEKATEAASEELAALRWHWTLDEENGKRISIREYARELGRGESTIREYASGYALWLEGARSIPLLEAMKRSQMGAETQVATEAVAKARGVKFGTAHEKRRTEIKRVRSIARERAEERGTTIEEEAPRVAEWIAESEKVKERLQAERNQKVNLRYVEMEGELVGAKRRLLNALRVAREVDWEPEHQELLTDTVEGVRLLLGLIDLALAGAANVDWDVELAKLTEGS